MNVFIPACEFESCDFREMRGVPHDLSGLLTYINIILHALHIIFMAIQARHYRWVMIAEERKIQTVTVAELNNKITVVVGRVGVETRNDLFPQRHFIL